MAKGTGAYAAAVDKLRAGLQNQYEVQRKVNEANTVAQKTLGDKSHAIENESKNVGESRDQYDRARDAIEKHTARLIADKDAVGLGAGAQEEFRARAQLTTAAIQAGIPITAAAVGRDR
jgi:hypothetical protein